jgi:hypothetical protein
MAKRKKDQASATNAACRGSASVCTQVVKSSRIKVEENRRKAVFRNYDNLEYEDSKIDDCVIKEGPRCDRLVSKVGKISVLIELKGSGVSHACTQLFESVEHPSVKPLLQEKIGFLVVCSKYPRFDTFVMKAKQMAARKYKAGIHVVCDQGEFDIERVASIDGPH